jgi:hypothetical protein
MYVLGLLLGRRWMRQTRRRGNLEAQLSLVGVTLAHGSLVLEPHATGQLRYHVLSHVQLLEDQQIKWLVWDCVEQGGQASPNSPSNHLALAGFLKLGDAPDSALIKFARRWGPLGNGWRRAVPDGFPGFPQSLGELVRTGAATHKVCEPVDAWRRLARQLEALLRLAAHLQGGQITPSFGPAAESWDIIDAADPRHERYRSWIDELSAARPLAAAWDHPTSAEVLGLQRSAIARVLHVWLKFGGVQARALLGRRTFAHGCPSRVQPGGGPTRPARARDRVRAGIAVWNRPMRQLRVSVRARKAPAAS